MTLEPGLYEQLITRELARALEAGEDELASERDELTEESAPELLARHVADAVRRVLDGVGGKDAMPRQVALANRVLAALAEESPEDISEGDDVTPELLLAVASRREGLGGARLARPGIPLRHSELIVNGPRDRRVGLEIARELASSDGVDLLMSFIKWSGFVELRDALVPVAARGRLRVLTTTYLGASDPEAVEALRELGAEIRVSYDERRTRLHAKAWLFHRATGFGTAIIGSSNLSQAALRDGCEWNVRLSRRDNPGLVAKFQTTFDQYWGDPAFEPFDAERFRQAGERRRDPARDALAHVVRLTPLPHQLAVLDALVAERGAGHTRNLVVAATGTGKTVIAALDYARQPGRPRLLFVAHRDRILDQSLATFRLALRDGHFGEKLTGRDKPILGTHVFASIQSLHAKRLGELAAEAFEVLVIDEFHHAAADTYTALLEHLRPRLLLGLTATPERADGRSVLGWFDQRVAAESRLWDALDQGLLVPFQYFVLHDGTDLSHVDFRGGRYDVAALSNLYTADDVRARGILRALSRHVRALTSMRALGFCVSVAHARFMAAFFKRHGIAAEVVVGDTAPGERDAHLAALERGDLQCIFTVDVLNEGVDVPRVDTVLFLRPTESATIFIQQLGRGLRLHEDKPCLTVLDFVGNARTEFRFDLRFRALLGGGTRRELTDAVAAGFPHLPSGCAIQLDPLAQKTILANLRQRVRSWAGLADDLEPGMGLGAFLERADVTLEEVYQPRHTFGELRHARGYVDRVPEGSVASALPRALHVDDAARLAPWRAWLDQTAPPTADLDDPAQRILFAALGQSGRPMSELPAFLAELWANDLVRAELRELLAVLDDRRRRLTRPLTGVPLQVHARYTRAEIAAALNLLTAKGKLLIVQQGVYCVAPLSLDLFFVTLDKDPRDFTPTTLYADYPITPTTFHWATQSRTRERSETGLRYRSPPPGWRHLLFVRNRKRDDRGVPEAFICLGPATYVSHEGERPMHITWRLDVPMPSDWFQTAKIAAG